MSSAQLDALVSLSTRLANDPTSRLLSSCLDISLEVAGASAAVAFIQADKLNLVEERGLPSGNQDDSVRQALHVVAERAMRNREALLLHPDNAHADPELSGLRGLSMPSLFAVPFVSGTVSLGALIALFPTGAVDLNAQVLLSTLANFLSLPIDRDQRAAHDLINSDELVEANRMASLGLLTATVAHELRGPAGALMLQQEELRRIVDQLLLLGGPNDAPLAGTVRELTELTRDIKIAVERIRDTVDQLSTMSRRETQPECVDLAHVVTDSLRVAHGHLERRGIKLHEQLDPACFTVGRRDNLVQVVLNLVFNAADACEASGEPQIWVKVQTAGEQVCLLVEDNGPGVPPETIPHIFRPFYTTKRRGQGTGLGLKICSDVVSAHGGHIEVHERPGGGASFQAILPRASEESGLMWISQAPDPLAESAVLPVRRILVVDDDPIFARTLRRALRPHEVRTATAASEAETLLLVEGYVPDLVLCDLFLPGKNGDSLHFRVNRERPEIGKRFVFVTGGALGKAEAEYLRNSGCRTLFKPVDLKSILELLDQRNELAPPNSVRTLSPIPPNVRVSTIPPPLHQNH